MGLTLQKIRRSLWGPRGLGRGGMRAGRPALPVLETLERREMLSLAAEAPRAVAATIANQAYVDGLIGTDRVLSPREAALRSRLTSRLNAGASREAVTTQLLKSLPSLQFEAGTVIRRMLGRAPRVGERDAAVGLLRRSGDERGLIASIAGSREYFRTQAGGTSGGYVRSIYRDVLLRDPTSGELEGALKSLGSGTSRAGLARALARSRESSALYIRSLHRQQGLGQVPGDDEFRMLARPGGLLKLTARVLASDEVFRTLVTPGGSTPTAPNSSFNAHPPGYPIAPGFDLNNRFQTLAVPSTLLVGSSNDIGAAPDGSLWIVGGFGVTTYDVNTGVMTSALTASLTGYLIAPLSGTEAYASTTSPSSTTPMLVHIVDLDYTALPDLPGSDSPSQLAASTDGLFWVLGTSGRLYSYQSATQAWATVPTDGFTLKDISIGSATNIVALATDLTALSYTTAGGFTAYPGLSGKVNAIAATADGTVWANVQTSTGNQVMVRPSYGTMQAAPIQPPSGMDVLYFAASSQYRAFQASLSTTGFQAELDLLDIGIVGRQAIPYPTYTGARQQAYLAMSQAAQVFVSGGVRTLYNMAGIDWGVIANDIATANRPSSIDKDDWDAVRDELKLEITYVSTVYGRLDLIKDLTTQIQIVNGNTLDAVYPIVGLSKPDGPDSGSSIGIVLQDIFEAIAGAISSSGIPAAGAVVASILSTGFDTAVAAFESSNPPGPNGAVAIEYSQLKTQLNSIFTSSLSQIDSNITSLVTDFGKAQAVAEAILNGQWPYPNGSGQQIANSATEAFKLYFYQSLTAAKWQIAETRWGDYLRYPFTASVDIPTYDNFEVPLGYELGFPTAEEYFMNQIGSQVNINSKDLGPFPIETLIENVGFLAGASFSDFWTGKNGWQIVKHVQATE